MKRFAETLWQPVDIAPLVFFRIGFGVLMLWEVWRYISDDRVSRYFIQPQFHFHYWGFDWVKPLPGDGMYWLFYVLGALAVCIILGMAYRVAMALFWVGISYVFLLDQTNHLNHMYLVCLFSFLLIFVPAHRTLSIDAWLRPKQWANDYAPAWALWLLRGQMALVYFYGGIAKLNPDWLRAEPIGTWLAARTDFPLIGSWFDERWMAYFFAYGGLLFDLLIVPFLLYRRTRWIALLVALGFHMTNNLLFDIGIFPYLAVVATVIFLPAHYFRWRTPIIPLETFKPRYALLVVFTLYFLIQILLPLRHFLYDGYVSWTEEGHLFAWHMKLRSKDGMMFMFVVDPMSGEYSELELENYLTPRQIDEMQDNPPMLLRFAHYLSKGDFIGMNIQAWSMMALNERAPQLLMDPFVNLAVQPDDLWADDWILPLRQPVPYEPPLPTLLLSRRIPGLLIIMNATTVAFPLTNLRMDFSGLDWQSATLPPTSCIVLYNDPMALATFAPLCNIQQTIDHLGVFRDFSVYYDAEMLGTCTSLSCVVNLPDGSLNTITIK